MTGIAHEHFGEENDGRNTDELRMIREYHALRPLFLAAQALIAEGQDPKREVATNSELTSSIDN